MQTQHQALAAAEIYSPAEEAFNRKRRTIGLFLAPIVFIVLLAAPLELAVTAHRTAAIVAAVMVLWITEALPLAATALLGPTLAVVMQVAPPRQVFAPFADPIIFLLIGSFILAQAMFVHGVDRRIAFAALSLRGVGASAFRILLVYGSVCTGLSMWISNTACTAMMFPIGLSIVGHVARTASVSQAQVSARRSERPRI
jgi:sodium-dependent dicarboxylate transporter 2/3/5